MGYVFYIISRDKDIQENDFISIKENLHPFYKEQVLTGVSGDVHYCKHYIKISGSYSLSGKHIEGFVLNIVINMINLGFVPKVMCKDWDYGSKQDWKWLDKVNK